MKFKKPKSFKTRNFDLHYLYSVINTKNSCVKMKRKKLHLNVHPLQLNDFNTSLMQILNQKITKYSKEYVSLTNINYFLYNSYCNICRLGGILLGYDDMNVLSNVGVINNDNCFIHVDIESNFFIFKPVIGQQLNGVVNKISTSHIACLVFNLFSVTVPTSGINDEWLEQEVENGKKVLLKINSVNLDCRLPYIKAEIL